ncbi:imelysin family protein [Pseudomonas citronellolis]|uniref:Imelysin family protein n=1 Tax=Pseudomonas citronellolis TaxID=53408 RepID=A0AAW6NYR3_9PSED|nr:MULTISPECIES: imelysin family protein [Pseudomonas]MBB1605377.1 peptidase [Pseudomonas sp. UMC76]MBB1641322.1 peptidase [Pseudomonas sp. UME83]MDF3840375.1 imelysin family protein [Pseudomonas citronellolis]NTX89159.1 peptidase [Pseudomonas sp. UMA643]NTY20141.1 peptidase [Pseudomonas sp. UMC3103]
MTRMPWATASLLAIAISLAGCGDDKKEASAPASQAATPAASTQSAAPAAAKVDEAAVKAVVKNYADMAEAVFSDSLTTAQALQKAVDAFLAKPSEETLKAAREAWLAARVPYSQSEAFRFGNKVVDDWEGAVNAWPLDEGLIDYVAKDYQHAEGNPAASANIVANTEIQVGEDKIDVKEITGEKLASLNEVAGSEANVATGYHAIEFLLWGQDLNGTKPGAGNRPYTDYVQGKDCSNGHCDRRAAYLKAVTDLLVTQLEEMVGNWKAGVADNYRAKLEADGADANLRKIFFGMGSLSLGELAGERMKVALEANSTEDEHDCFSDNTHHTLYFNAEGIRNIYLGEYKRVDGSLVKGPSVADLVAKADAQANTDLKADLDATQAKMQAIVDRAEKDGVHFDQMIAPADEADHKIISDAIASLVKQTGAIEKAAAALGIQDLKPDNADHQF